VRSSPLAGLRLLVVEDEALVAMLIEDLLRDLGCTVVGPVGSVARALALLRREAIDGALLDVNLGKERSYPVADALAARGVPFVFLTGYAEIDGSHAAACVLQKPLAAAALARTLAATFAGTSSPQQGSGGR
jgi:CheY-like chemotaxis protein